MVMDEVAVDVGPGGVFGAVSISGSAERIPAVRIKQRKRVFMGVVFCVLSGRCAWASVWKPLWQSESYRKNGR